MTWALFVAICAAAIASGTSIVLPAVGEILARLAD